MADREAWSRDAGCTYAHIPMFQGSSGTYMYAKASTSNETTWFLQRRSDHKDFTNDVSIKLNHGWDDIEELGRIFSNWVYSKSPSQLNTQLDSEGTSPRLNDLCYYLRNIPFI